MESGDEQYHPKDAVRAAINGTMITGAAGGLVSAIQNTMTKRNSNAWGVFTKTGGTIAIFGKCSDTLRILQNSADIVAAAMGGTYEFTRFASANLRERDDSLNTAIGGFLAGSLLGLKGAYTTLEQLSRKTCSFIQSWHNTCGPRFRCFGCGCAGYIRLHRWSADRLQERS